MTIVCLDCDLIVRVCIAELAVSDRHCRHWYRRPTDNSTRNSLRMERVGLILPTTRTDLRLRPLPAGPSMICSLRQKRFHPIGGVSDFRL